MFISHANVNCLHETVNKIQNIRFNPQPKHSGLQQMCPTCKGLINITIHRHILLKEKNGHEANVNMLKLFEQKL